MTIKSLETICESIRAQYAKPVVLDTAAGAAAAKVNSGYYKELCTKLGWAIGTTYGMPYRSSSPASEFAQTVARILTKCD